MKRFSFSNFMLIAGMAFIYLPMLILVIYSFNASRLVTVWGGWSLHWYLGLLDNAQLMSSVGRSLEIALYTAIAATARNSSPSGQPKATAPSAPRSAARSGRAERSDSSPKLSSARAIAGSMSLAIQPASRQPSAAIARALR